jgi:hypothetical protein
MAAAFPRAGNRCWVPFRTLCIPTRCDLAWVLTGANHKRVGGGGRGNSAGRIQQAMALDNLVASRWEKARTAMEFAPACSVKGMTTSSVEKPAARFARTTTMDMNASEEVT